MSPWRGVEPRSRAARWVTGACTDPIYYQGLEKRLNYMKMRLARHNDLFLCRARQIPQEDDTVSHKTQSEKSPSLVPGGVTR